MSAYSYQEWNSLSVDEKKANPGISISRDNPINNPNRGVYWSGPSSASALMTYLKEELSSDDRNSADLMFRKLKETYRTAAQTDNSIKNAMQPRQEDAYRAIKSSNLNLTDKQIDMLNLITIDIYNAQIKSRLAGIDSEKAVKYMINKSSAASVGFEPSKVIPDEYKAYLETDEGIEDQKNLNKLFKDLYQDIQIKDFEFVSDINNDDKNEINVKEVDITSEAIGEPVDKKEVIKNTYDALDLADNLSDQFLIDQDRTRDDELELIKSIVGSIPLQKDAAVIENSDYFSVIMDTAAEAKAMEEILKWVGEKDDLPEKEEIYEKFASWNDSGLVSSPFEERNSTRIGVIVGSGNEAKENMRGLVDEFKELQNIQLVIMGVELENLENVESFEGRPIFSTKAIANKYGVSIANIDNAPDNAIILLNQNYDETNNPERLSIVSNAFVGSTSSIIHMAGNGFKRYESNAIHVASNAGKLTSALDKEGKPLGMAIVGRELIYQTNSNGSPKRYTKEDYKNAKEKIEKEIKALEDKNKKLIAEGKEPIKNNISRSVGYAVNDKIPKLDKDGKKLVRLIKENRLNQLRQHARDIEIRNDPNRYFAANLGNTGNYVKSIAFDGARKYDVAIRTYGKGADPMADAYSKMGKNSTILTTDNKDMASYAWLMKNATDRKILYAVAERNLSFAEDLSLGNGNEGKKIVSREASTNLTIYKLPEKDRKGLPSEVVKWNDPELKGAILLVSGKATSTVKNAAAQANKIAQEAIVDWSKSGVIFDDMQKDFHAAHMTKLALEMGKNFTIVNKEGKTVPIENARNITKHNAQSFTEVARAETFDRLKGKLDGLDVDNYNNKGLKLHTLSDPIGQLTLAGLKGMNHEKAQKLSDLKYTLEEIFTNKDQSIKEDLYKNGMPSETIKSLGDNNVWKKSIERALTNNAAAETLASEFGDSIKNPEIFPKGRAGFIYGEKTKLPVASFIGNALPTNDGINGKAVQPQDMVDRKQLRDTMQQMTDKGYAIGVAFEEGVGLAVLEEASKIKNAEVVVNTSGNPMAANTEMRLALNNLLENGKTSVIMPVNIARTTFTHNKDENDQEDRSYRYGDYRNVMHENIAHNTDIAVVVALSSSDQTLHIVDKVNKMDKPIVVMVPKDTDLAASEAYRGNLKILRGAGKTEIESVGLSQAPTPNGYAEINDINTKYSNVGGVMRGDAGTFKSARLSRSDMMYNGHNYKSMGWGSAAQAISSEHSVNRITDLHKEGNLKPLGEYVEPTQRELERRSIERFEYHREARGIFEKQQNQNMKHVMEDAARNVTY